MKTTSFNLIILDESGSMDSSRLATINGCNEVLNTIRSLQKEHADTQRYLASVYAFQSGSSVPSRYIVKNYPIADVKDITEKQYEPCGCTPMLDAIGQTLTDLKAIADTHEDAVATVTIITDGYENSSTQYTWQEVNRMISRLKELGWTFNFIGANIDVEAVAKRMNIDNSLAYTSDANGTRHMFENFGACQRNFEATRIRAEEAAPAMSREEKIHRRMSHSKTFFKR